MRRACDWFVPKSVEITYTFAGVSKTYSGSDFPEFSYLEANCGERRIKKLLELINLQSPRDSTPWALAQNGPDALVIGFLPIDPDDTFQTFAPCTGPNGVIPESSWPRNLYCPLDLPRCDLEDPNLSQIENGLGAIPSMARFIQRCYDPTCPQPFDPFTCPYEETYGVATTGIGAMWKPRKLAVATPCISAGLYVPFGYIADPNNPATWMQGTANLRTGTLGKVYTYGGQPLGDVTVETKVEF